MNRCPFCGATLERGVEHDNTTFCIIALQRRVAALEGAIAHQVPRPIGPPLV